MRRRPDGRVVPVPVGPEGEALGERMGRGRIGARTTVPAGPRRSRRSGNGRVGGIAAGVASAIRACPCYGAAGLVRLRAEPGQQGEPPARPGGAVAEVLVGRGGAATAICVGSEAAGDEPLAVRRDQVDQPVAGPVGTGDVRVGPVRGAGLRSDLRRRRPGSGRGGRPGRGRPPRARAVRRRDHGLQRLVHCAGRRPAPAGMDRGQDVGRRVEQRDRDAVGDEDASVTPGVAVTRASVAVTAPPARWCHAPCPRVRPRGGGAVDLLGEDHVRRDRRRSSGRPGRFSTTDAWSSPTCRPRLSERYGPVETPPWRVVTATDAPQRLAPGHQQDAARVVPARDQRARYGGHDPTSCP